jgi:putative transposase
MDDYESLSHTKWECKYHVVFIPKCRRKTLFGQIRQHLGEVFHKLAAQKESQTGAASATPPAALSGSHLRGRVSDLQWPLRAAPN